MDALTHGEHIIKTITSALDFPGILIGRIAAWLIIPMVAALVYEVISRYFFDSPTIWAYDITYMLYGSIFMLGAAYALAKDAHVRADIIYGYLPMRWQGAIDALFYLCLYFPTMAIFTYLTYKYALDSWKMGETIPTSPWMPIIYPYKTVMPVAGALLFIQGLSQFIKSL